MSIFSFKFRVTNESETFCREIINVMIQLFEISSEEALGRLNEHWKGNDFTDEDDIRYHEDESFWAYDIYYGHDSLWWTNPGQLTPLPYP